MLSHGLCEVESRTEPVPVHIALLQKTLLLRAGLRIKENKEVYEGEVTELTPEYTEGQVGYARE